MFVRVKQVLFVEKEEKNIKISNFIVQKFALFQQERFVEVGRVAFIAYGDDKGKLCVILDVIDQNRV